MFYQFSHFGISEYFKKERGKNFSFPAHLHHSFELIIILEGKMTVTIDKEKYILTKNEAVLIFPNRLHILQSSDSRHILFIFSPELIKAFGLKTQNLYPVNSKFKISRSLLEYLLKLKSSSPLFEKKGVLYLICAEFNRNAEYRTNKSPDNNLLMQIFSFVENNFQSDCSLKEISRNTGYSYSYISRYFKNATGVSLNTYLNRYRIRNACYLLSNTGSSVLQCALDSGYSSLRSFNRNFIELLGITPSEYRTGIITSQNYKTSVNPIDS